MNYVIYNKKTGLIISKISLSPNVPVPSPDSNDHGVCGIGDEFSEVHKYRIDNGACVKKMNIELKADLRTHRK